MKKELPKIVVILGPTATGKSDLAVRLAQKFNGEIVSADSRQVYRGFDIGAGKITRTEMKGIPHHLLDVADPKSIYSVEEYKKSAAQAITEIVSRGTLPIIAGGTGFYIDTLVFGEEFPNVPPNQKLRERLEKKSAAALMREIQRLDQKRAKTLDPYNKVRIVRAIEIARALGSVPKVKRTKLYDPLFIGLTLDSAKLRENIRTRLLKRMKGGKLVREISNLHAHGLSWKRLHTLGLEYRYISLYLRNKMSKKEMLSKLEQEIAQYARRQMQWFRRNKGILWFEPKDVLKIEAVIRQWVKSPKA